MQVFLISFGEGRWEVGDFLSSRAIDFPVLLDTNKKCGANFGVWGVPKTFILNHKCEIVFSTQGVTPNYEVLIREKIKPRLNELWKN